MVSLILTNSELTKKGEILQFRAELEKDIEWLNENHIAGNPDGITRDIAFEVRKKLIEANNAINTFRLKNL